MTVETHKVLPGRDDFSVDDSIDLRLYLNILVKWWREIAFITLTCTVLAILAIFLMRMFLPVRYQANADVAIVRRVSNVNFDERFQTNPEELGTNTANLSARRSALLGLVATGTIARKVVFQLGDILTPEEQVPANLLEMIAGEETGGGQNDSDLIRITATANTPEKAALIATTWAQTYVKEINTIYGQVPDEVFSSIENEQTQAWQSYLNSQKDLETFINSNRIDELTSQIAVLQQRVTQEVSLQQAILLKWQKTQEQLASAQSLHVQIEAGGEGAARSNMAALQILKMNVYSEIPGQLQIEVRDMPEVTAEAMLIDLEGLIISLERQLQDLDSQIATSRIDLTSDSGIDVPVLVDTLQALRAAKSQLETETSRQLQLVQQRDLNWGTFKTLNSKVAELNLTRAAASSEVRLGAEAISPVQPTRRIRLSTGVAVALLLGFMMSVVIVFFADYLGRIPVLNRGQS